MLMWEIISGKLQTVKWQAKVNIQKIELFLKIYIKYTFFV